VGSLGSWGEVLEEVFHWHEHLGMVFHLFDGFILSRGCFDRSL
jgi:hypothetical protein